LAQSLRQGEQRQTLADGLLVRRMKVFRIARINGDRKSGVGYGGGSKRLRISQSEVTRRTSS
jgi:hypothetical protein